MQKISMNILRSVDIKALRKVLFTMEPPEVIQVISDSNLRGRGGGGFPTGYKWQQVARQAEKIRYVVCNGDEEIRVRSWIEA